MNSYCFFFLVFLCFASCKKQNEEKINLNVSGTWELVSVGSLGGFTEYPPGNGHVLILKSDGYLELQEPGQPSETGHYSLSKEKERCGPDVPQVEVVILTFHTARGDSKHHVAIDGNLLKLNSVFCAVDGSYFVYRRI
jgi:hypothetical protein